MRDVERNCTSLSVYKIFAKNLNIRQMTFDVTSHDTFLCSTYHAHMHLATANIRKAQRFITRPRYVREKERFENVSPCDVDNYETPQTKENAARLPKNDFFRST